MFENGFPTEWTMSLDEMRHSELGILRICLKHEDMLESEIKRSKLEKNVSTKNYKVFG